MVGAPGDLPRRGFLVGSLLVGVGTLASCTKGADRPAPQVSSTAAPTPPPPPARVSLAVVGATAPAGASASPAGASASPAAASASPAASQAAPAGSGASAEPAGPWTGARTRPRLAVQVTGGTLASVVVRAGGQQAAEGAEVPGAVGQDGAWAPTDPLELGATYRAVATATDPDGATATDELSFTVVGEDGAVRARMMPLPDEKVGVGMPVVLYLTRPVADDQRRALTDAMAVETGAGVEGAWRWFSDTEAHWRPREYWPANTVVRVRVPLTEVDVGGGRFGAADRDFTFTVGDAHTSVVDADTHQMTTSVNGAVVRTFPVSCGRDDAGPSTVTRSGVALVLEKHADFVMDGATVGRDYRTPVKWATRITNSGEFVHGAPWSVPDQGVRNVSHGCVNASDEDARWFYELSLRGDPVEVRGTDRPMELTNGLGDWTLPWDRWTTA